jgi:hypothetical protein
LLAPPVGIGELSIAVEVVGFAVKEGGLGVMDGGTVVIICGGADELSVEVAAGDDESAREEVSDALSGDNVETAAEGEDKGQREDNLADDRLVRETSGVGDSLVVIVVEGDTSQGDDDTGRELPDPETVDDADQDDGEICTEPLVTVDGDGTKGKFGDVCRGVLVEDNIGDVCEGSTCTGTDLLREDAGTEKKNDSAVESLVRPDEPIEPSNCDPEPLGRGGRTEVGAENGLDDEADEGTVQDVSLITEPLDVADE